MVATPEILLTTTSVENGGYCRNCQSFIRQISQIQEVQASPLSQKNNVLKSGIGRKLYDEQSNEQRVDNEDVCVKLLEANTASLFRKWAKKHSLKKIFSIYMFIFFYFRIGQQINHRNCKLRVLKCVCPHFTGACPLPGYVLGLNVNYVDFAGFSIQILLQHWSQQISLFYTKPVLSQPIHILVVGV